MLHQIDYSYSIPEWATIEMDIDPDLPLAEKEEIAIDELANLYPNIQDIEIEDVRFN